VPIYKYKAKDRSGLNVQGTVEAISASQVAQKLSSLGHTPLYIVEQQVSGSAKFMEALVQYQPIKTEELIVFVRQLSSILGAGVPLLESLEALYEQMVSPKFKAIILKIRQDIEGGASLSEALAREKKVFPTVFIAMVKAGEKAGIMGEVLEKLADLLEKEYENNQKIKSATRYPIIVVGALMVAFVIIITFVIPRFVGLYASFKGELPLPTRLLLGINYIVKNYWLLILLVSGGSYYGFKSFVETEFGGWWWDDFSLKVPVFGALVSKLRLARFCRMLSSMLHSGIPILDALSISRDTAGNKVLAKAIDDIRQEVGKGSTVSDPMRKFKLFPPLAVQMVAIGERSGSLEAMLTKVADYFDRDADYMIKNLTPLIEPMLLLGLAVMVTIFALGVFLPMWDMSRLIK